MRILSKVKRSIVTGGVVLSLLVSSVCHTGAVAGAESGIGVGIDGDNMEDENTQEDVTAYMQTLKLNWDLKKGKTLKLTSKFPGIGKKKYNVKMTAYKIEDAKKEGYKKLTFSYVSTRMWSPSKKEVDKIFDTSYKKWGQDYVYFSDASAYAVVDYNTGVSLEGENEYGITVSNKFKHSKLIKYKGTKGNWIKLSKKTVVKVRVLYPSDYTNLCIGVLGENKTRKYEDGISVGTGGDGSISYGFSTITSEFFDARKLVRVKKDEYMEDENGIPFLYGQTAYYKKGKSNSHWLRVN